MIHSLVQKQQEKNRYINSRVAWWATYKAKKKILAFSKNTLKKPENDKYVMPRYHRNNLYMYIHFFNKLLNKDPERRLGHPELGARWPSESTIFSPNRLCNNLMYKTCIKWSVIAFFSSKLLNKNPERRLGHPELGGPLAIREHDFFTDINWVDMYLKKTEPPLKSFMTIKSDLDLINFDNLPDDNEQVRNIFTYLLMQVKKIKSELDLLNFLQKKI